MSSVFSSDTPGRSTGRQAAARAERSPWLERAARLGYAARGLLYAVIGITALEVALGRGGQTQGTTGALRSLAGEPFGYALLVAVAVGLAGYALWRLAQTFFHRSEKDSLAAKVVERISFLFRALLYGAFAWYAVQLLLGSGGGAGGSGGGSGGSGGSRALTARLLGLPGGQWIVVAGGAIVLGVAAYQCYLGVTRNFEDDLKQAEMSRRERRWIGRFGMVGYLGRGVVYGIVGALLVVAAFQVKPDDAVGMDGALSRLANQPYGPWLLGAVAVGLFAFGLYCFAEARYREVNVR